MPTLRRTFARHALATALLLALALLLVSGWGQIHRVLHPGGTAVAVASDGAKASASGWGHEDGSGLCQLLDQLTHGDAPVAAPAWALPVAEHVTPAASARAVVWVARPRGFDARAPPLSA